MSLSSGQLAQMEAAAINRMKMDIENPKAQIEYFLREIREGRLVEVVRCKDCIYNDASKDESGYHCTRYGMWGNDGSSFYCKDGERKGKDNG